jgi:hypothetical protein
MQNIQQRITIAFSTRPERFELPTTWFVARYSIQLSYGRVLETNVTHFTDFIANVKQSFQLLIGEGGIRTLDGAFWPHTPLAGERLQPLGHLSKAAPVMKLAFLTYSLLSVLSNLLSRFLRTVVVVVVDAGAGAAETTSSGFEGTVFSC